MAIISKSSLILLIFLIKFFIQFFFNSVSGLIINTKRVFAILNILLFAHPYPRFFLDKKYLICGYFFLIFSFQILSLELSNKTILSPCSNNLRQLKITFSLLKKAIPMIISLILLFFLFNVLYYFFLS